MFGRSKKPKRIRRQPTAAEIAERRRQKVDNITVGGVGLVCAVVLRITLQPELYLQSDSRVIATIAFVGIYMAGWGLLDMWAIRRGRAGTDDDPPV